MLTRTYKMKQMGFTLVELSIVLIIIGFIIAGVAGGHMLVRSANLRAVISETQSIQSAVQTFSLKYHALPGDMANATDIFGTTDKNGFTVNNGNGDGCIGANNCVDSWNPNSTESFAATQELALEGLIPGVYTGETDPASDNNGQTAGINALGSRYGGTYAFFSSNFWGDYANNINVVGMTKFITAADTYSIDNKIDDGMPLTGSMFTHTPSCGISSDNCVNVDICSSAIDKTQPYIPNDDFLCVTQFAVSGLKEFK